MSEHGFMRTDVTDLSLTDLMAQAGVLSQQGQVPVAIALYRAWLAVRVADPLRYVALFNLGVLHGSLQQPQEAEPLYREALRLQPTLLQARLNLGHALENQGKLDDAVAQWQQVLDELAAVPQPDVALQLHALNNLARALESAKRYDEAEAYMARSLQVEPDQSAVLQHYVHIRQKQCKWPVYQPIGDVTINRQLLSTSALAMLAAYDDPALQLLAARQFVHEKTQAPVPRKPRRVRQAGERIRIGYLSGDLCMHAVGLLTVELFELHDRSRFEVFGFCWSNDDGSPLRERLIKAFDHHVRIGHLSDEQAAQV